MNLRILISYLTIKKDNLLFFENVYNNFLIYQFCSSNNQANSQIKNLIFDVYKF